MFQSSHSWNTSLIVIFLQDEAGILNIPRPGKLCLNKHMVGQEIILQHPTRMCIEVPVIIILKHMQVFGKHKHKPVVYKRKIHSSE